MSQLAKGLGAHLTDTADSKTFSCQAEGLCIFNSQKLAEPIVQSIWDNINIGMADVDRNVVLDQVNIDLILSPIGYQILNRTKNRRMLDDDQVHPLDDGFRHRLLPDI